MVNHFRTCSAVYRLFYPVSSLGWPMGIDIALTCLIFMILGKYIRLLIDWCRKLSFVFVLSISALMTVIAILISLNNVPEGYDNCVVALGAYGRNYLLFIIAALLNTSAVALMCARLERQMKWLRFICRNTYFFMGVPLYYFYMDSSYGAHIMFVD